MNGLVSINYLVLLNWNLNCRDQFMSIFCGTRQISHSLVERLLLGCELWQIVATVTVKTACAKDKTFSVALDNGQ